ncbi:MAG: GNAT family N-acetyltransferase [Candidatus Egerieousia sp.]
MNIDKHKAYIFGRYSYVNFCQLSRDEVLAILNWRNNPNIRKCMNNTECISVEEHLAFCKSLQDRTDKYYWLILKRNEPVGVLNIIDVDENLGTCEPGFYLAPSAMGKGESIFLLSNYKTFLLKELNFKGLIGHNYYDNMQAFMFTMFFGGRITDVYEINERLSIKTILTGDSLQNEEGTERLVLKYAQFARSWDADEVINSFRNGK